MFWFESKNQECKKEGFRKSFSGCHLWIPLSKRERDDSRETLQTVPAFLSLSLRPNDLLSRSQSSAGAEWGGATLPCQRDRQAGRQASRPRNCSKETSFRPSLPSHPFFPESSSPVSPPLWTFSPLQRNVFHHLATWPGGQAGRPGPDHLHAVRPSLARRGEGLEG